MYQQAPLQVDNTCFFRYEGLWNYQLKNVIMMFIICMIMCMQIVNSAGKLEHKVDAFKMSNHDY